MGFARMAFERSRPHCRLGPVVGRAELVVGSSLDLVDSMGVVVDSLELIEFKNIT